MDFMKHLYQPIPIKIKLAPWWKRLGSLLIDIFLMSVILTPFQKFLPNTPDFNATYSTANYLIAFLIITYFLTYIIIMQYLTQQTIGMMLLNIIITNNTKKEIKLWQIIVRNIFLIPIFPFIILWIVDPVYLLLTGMRLSEKWSKTKTI